MQHAGRGRPRLLVTHCPCPTTMTGAPGGMKVWLESMAPSNFCVLLEVTQKTAFWRLETIRQKNPSEIGQWRRATLT